MTAGVPFIVGWVLSHGEGGVNTCGANPVLVVEIDDRIRFSKHFVILGNVEGLGLLDA